MNIASETHWDVFEVIDGERCHVGIAYEFTSLPDEHPELFRASVERRAKQFRVVSEGEDPSSTGVMTMFRGGEVQHAIIVIRTEPRPAPLKAPMRGKRGKGISKETVTA